MLARAADCDDVIVMNIIKIKIWRRTSAPFSLCLTTQKMLPPPLITPLNLALGERLMAECIKIPSSTPEYNAVVKSYEEINSAIAAIPNEFASRAHSCGLIPTRNLSRPSLDVVLDEVSRDPVHYYSLQHVLDTLNERNRFDKGISKMETTFRGKLKL